MSVLRDYQVDAVAAVRGYLAINEMGNPIVSACTGAGKTHIIAELCKDWAAKGKRALVLAHRKELLEQGVDKLRRADPNLPVGIFSASIGQKDPHKPVTFAGIQSVFNKAHLFNPPIDYIIVDECHRVPMAKDSMYMTLLAGMPGARVVGMTATPYRLDSGPLCNPGTKGNTFDAIVYETDLRDLIARGHLSKLRSKAVRNAVDDSLLRIQQGEFKEEDFNAAMDDAKLSNAMGEWLLACRDRKSILVFASGVNHGARIADYLVRQGVQGVAVVTGTTSMEDRSRYVEEFKVGKIRILINVMVFVEGFDSPNVDAVILMRATLSPGLFVQMCGRGLRTCEGKADCVVYDYGKNIQRHGPIDDLAIGPKPRRGEPSKVKECPSCGEQVALKFAVCPCCGAEFPKKSRGGPELDEQADDKDILGRRSNAPRTMDVAWVRYQVIEARNGKPPILRVEYNPQGGGPAVSEFVCFAHVGFARNKAVEWWAKRGGGACPTEPAMVREAVKQLARPTRITVYREMDRYGKPTPYERVVVDPKDLVPPKARVEADTLFAGGDPYSAR